MRKYLYLILLLTACGGDDERKTYDVAREYADHVCAYFERCDALAGQPFEDCVALVVEGTCPEGGCSTDDTWNGDAEQFDLCLAELDIWDCAFVNDEPPTDCADVL